MSLNKDQFIVNLKTPCDQQVSCYGLAQLAEHFGQSIDHLPYSIRVLLENNLRHLDDPWVGPQVLQSILSWSPENNEHPEVPYMPSRVVMQDFTGVPAVVDFAAMREAFKQAGGDPDLINPSVDTALVVDHSVQVDHFGNAKALDDNIAIEYQRNEERYTLLKWAQNSLANFKVVPPGMGIIHQVNLEHLAQVVMTKQDSQGRNMAYPDSLVGTDSHTTMINGLGVMGWGVGGIEAEAVMLGQPYFMLLPDVIGVRFSGQLSEGVSATDLVLKVTERLRAFGVVGKFVEFFGPGLANLALPDRATLANMAPEYGATMGFFPVDDQTCEYLSLTDRQASADLAKTVLSAQGLYRSDDHKEPQYTHVIELDLGEVDSTLAGPKRPQDRVPLRALKTSFSQDLTKSASQRGFELKKKDLGKEVKLQGMDGQLSHGSIVIAAITSCTNTSNPRVMVGAGLLAKKAVELGLTVKPFVKTSLAPGSQVVTEYLKQAGLLEYFEKLHFNVVGYGCTTCIGNSGPLADPIAKAIEENDLVAAAVLSGNRNFEGRISPHVKANYLASPIHVVAFALAGTVLFDPDHDPIGQGEQGPVFLKDIWPTDQAIDEIMQSLITPEMYQQRYESVFEGTADWRALSATTTSLYDWDKQSTYIRQPDFFKGFNHFKGPQDIIDARVLVKVGDSVTTDHISPAGAIRQDYPAGQYLLEHGVALQDFNSYGSRRGNHEVMMRGTFGNVRLRNQLCPEVEGSFTCYHPTKEVQSIFEAAMAYEASQTPLVVLAGKEYGTGSSRDWAAKGTLLLGVKAVIAQSYERIHRSNLVGMGVLPLEFVDGQSADSLGLNGTEVYSIRELADLKPGQNLVVQARTDQGQVIEFAVKVRLDTAVEVSYYVHGGILQTVLNQRLKQAKS